MMSIHDHPTEVCIFSPARSIEHIELCADLRQHLKLLPQLISNPHAVKPHQVLMFDCSEVSASRIEQWLMLQHKAAQTCHCVLIKVCPGAEHEALMEWPQITGLFYHDASSRMISNGLMNILEGELVLPSALMRAFVKRLRRIPSTPRLSGHPIELTRRELQILDCVYSGFSNARIADTLALSEHTIKTHLSNAYRKIGISSRLEACAWVRENYANLRLPERLLG